MSIHCTVPLLCNSAAALSSFFTHESLSPPTTTVFAPNSSLGEKIKGAYMPSWVLLGMTAIEERVRKRTTKL
jgi:hypothetical protein